MTNFCGPFVGPRTFLWRGFVFLEGGDHHRTILMYPASPPPLLSRPPFSPLFSHTRLLPFLSLSHPNSPPTSDPTLPNTGPYGICCVLMGIGFGIGLKKGGMGVEIERGRGGGEGLENKEIGRKKKGKGMGKEWERNGKEMGKKWGVAEKQEI